MFVPMKTSPPSTPSKSVQDVSEFRGVDMNNNPSNVDIQRSPSAPNMIRDVPGKVRKRMGYKKIKSYPARINGAYLLIGEDSTKEIIHAGTKLYDGDTEIFDGLKDERSVAWQMNRKLYLMDGQTYIVYGEFEKETTETADEGDETEEKPKEWVVKKVQDIAYVPKILISRNPDGGGTALDPINLLSTKWTEGFLGKDNIKDYQLSSGDLDETPVTAKVLQKDGTWKDLKETTDFTVDRKTGKVTFTTAPGASPVSGADNVEITASKVRKGYLERINKCDTAILFGINGASDRVFCTGNPEFPNQDWYSQMNDPTYMGDLWYSVLGQDSGRVVAYSVVSDRLAAHKDVGEDGRNCILRRGSLDENGKAIFPLSNTLQGGGTVAKYSIGYLGTEPIFLTRSGLFAITPQDITGERYSQGRSFYINRALTAEKDLKNAYSCVYNDFYLLSVNKKVYIMDGLGKYYEKGAPYSTYQYDCYYWDNVDARIMWERDGRLYFGTPDGDIMQFYQDYSAQESYNDNGEAIKAHWDTPDLDGKLFYQNKTFKYLALRLAPAISTSVQVFVQKKGIWSLLTEEFTKARYFSWPHITWSKWTWATDTTPKTLGLKIKVKKVDKARYRFSNEVLNEPFGLFDLALEYSERGKYK